jgi:hypothetical protein
MNSTTSMGNAGITNGDKGKSNISKPAQHTQLIEWFCKKPITTLEAGAVDDT